MPVTFYENLDDLPPLGDYDITKGRTYMYFEGGVLYPFGHGLSYTTFDYSNIRLSKETITTTGKDSITVRVDVKNSGTRLGDEVVQLYVRDTDSSVVQPIKRLRDFRRVTLKKGESKTVSFELIHEDLSYWDESQKDWVVEPGTFEVQLGASSTDIRLSRIVAAGQY